MHSLPPTNIITDVSGIFNIKVYFKHVRELLNKIGSYRTHYITLSGCHYRFMNEFSL